MHMVINFNEYIHLHDLYLLIWNMHYNVSTMCGNIAGHNFLKVLSVLSYGSECLHVTKNETHVGFSVSRT